VDSFSAGIEFERLRQAVEQHMRECLAYRIEHENNPGAHAAAFDAHGLSPGIVEEAEKVAEQILDTAMESLEEATQASLEAATTAGESLQEAVEAATTSAAKATETTGEVATGIIPLPDREPVKKKPPTPEREPYRPHPMHKSLKLRRG
jgi:hypothetical protein